MISGGSGPRKDLFHKHAKKLDHPYRSAHERRRSGCRFLATDHSHCRTDAVRDHQFPTEGESVIIAIIIFAVISAWAAFFAWAVKR